MQVGDVYPKSIATTVHESNETKFGHISSLPDEIFLEIFALAKPALQEIAQVSTKWKELAYDDKFYNQIIPSFRFGEEDWIKHVGVPEKETHVPYCIFKELESGEGFLTWVTETVQITKEDGTVENVILDSGLKIESLFQNLNEDQTFFHENACRDAIEEPRTCERSHWVWIQKELIGRNKYYADQALALAQSTEKGVTNGANVSGFIDTLLTVSLEKIRSGKSWIEIIPKSSNNQITWIRVKEQTNTRRVSFGFPADDLNVRINFSDLPFDSVAVLVSRKSSGL